MSGGSDIKASNSMPSQKQALDRMLQDWPNQGASPISLPSFCAASVVTSDLASLKRTRNPVPRSPKRERKRERRSTIVYSHKC